MIIATGLIRVAPAQVHAVLADLRAGIAYSLQEDGCRFYTFALEDEAAGSILTLQIWRDEEALAAHLCNPHIRSLLAKWDGQLDVHTKIYDADHERPVGDWRNPELGPMIAASRR
ncbi:MAG: antibiotic biosynthesis monooxygenase [Alphaproteobacteria bacterium]|nr:antibiotic biosynthesis monooxygenase [Alphaproteobacteria bacterium]